MRTNSSPTFFLFLCISLCAIVSATAQTIWTDTAGDWFDAANWSAGVPTAATSAQINNGGTATIENGGAGTVLNLTLGNGTSESGTVKVNGFFAAASLTASGSLTVGNGTNSTGTLNIDGPASVSNTSAVIANNAGSTGTVALDGFFGAAIWTNNGSLTVGNSGNGTLTAQGPAMITNDSAIIADQKNSIGLVDLNGFNDTVTWTNNGSLTIGNSGKGTLTAEGPVTITNDSATIADQMGSTGTVTFDAFFGAVTWTNNGSLTIGNSGNGTLNGADGTITSDSGTIANQKNSTGVANIGGGSWTMTGGLIVGNSGNGTLHISAGGTVSNAFGQIGSGSGSTGTVTVDGMGSTWTNNGTFIIGGTGTGSMTITRGGAVSSNMSLMGASSGGHGTAIVDGTGSSWTTTSLYVGGDPTGTKGTGLLRILNGGTVSATTAATVWLQGALEIGASYTLTTPSLTFDGGALRPIANTNFINNATLAAGGVRVDPNGFTSTLSGTYSGVGGLSVDFDGTIILTNSNNYSGGTVTREGSTLVVDNANALGTGDVTLFSGRSTLETRDNSPRSFVVGGGYFQTAGTLRMQLGGVVSGVQSDFMNVVGVANLEPVGTGASSLFLHRINNYTPAPGDTILILQAGGGVVNQWDNVSNDFTGLLRPTVVYHPNSVDVVFTQSSFNIGGLTPNQRAVANGLNSSSSDPRALALVTFLDSELPGDLARDYDLIAPEELASIYEVGFSQAFVQNMNLQHRMDDIRAGSNGFCANGYTPQISGKDVTPAIQDKNVATPDKNTREVFTPAPDNRWGVFVTGSGDFVNVGDEDANAHGYDITTGNVTVGVDYRLGNHFAIGVDGSYAGSTADLVNDGRVEVDGGKAGAYATLYGYKIFGSVIHIDGAASGGWNNYDTRRTGLQDISVRGSTNGSEFNALLAYGADWHFGCFLIGTWSSLQYTNINIDSFTETGSLAPLHIEDQDEDSIRSTTGARIAYDLKCGRTIFRPEVRAGWQHESADRAYPIDSRFASGAGNVFTVHGPKIGRDSALVDAGFSILWSDRVSTYVYYDGVFGRSNYNSNAVSGGFRISF